MRGSNGGSVEAIGRGACLRAAFTLIEMLVVIGVIALLMAIAAPAIRRGVAAAGRAACASNVKQMFTAWSAYLVDHEGRFFPFREDRPDGVLWYWGFERGGGGGEGERSLDKSRARLAPYFSGGIETCPALTMSGPYFKRKFEIASYGYGINGYLLAGLPGTTKMGVYSIDRVARPALTVAWGDSIQINTWQAPASASRPLLEEWYVLDNSPPPHVHFRHHNAANIVTVDGSLRAFPPHTLDPRCDGQTGYIEKPGQETWYQTSP